MIDQQRPTIVPPQWLMDAWQARIETMGADVPAILSEVAQWGYEQSFKLPACFHGVPLIPPIDCVDPQSWIAQKIYDMGYDQRGEVNEAKLQQARDQELEACIAWFDKHIPGYELVADRLRTARRPKPPSLKEQAQFELDRLIALIPSEGALAMAEPIRRALEALPDD